MTSCWYQFGSHLPWGDPLTCRETISSLSQSLHPRSSRYLNQPTNLCTSTYTGWGRSPDVAGRLQLVEEQQVLECMVLRKFRSGEKLVILFNFVSNLKCLIRNFFSLLEMLSSRISGSSVFIEIDCYLRKQYLRLSSDFHVILTAPSWLFKDFNRSLTIVAHLNDQI